VPSTKRVDSSGRATVEFRLPPEAGATKAWLAGEFNDWSVETHPLEQVDDGSLVTTVELDPGSYRFRYYLGDGEWENDWAADAYVDNEHGGQDSLIVIPPVEEAPPPAAMGDTPQRAEEPVKKAAAKKKAPAKKAATTKKAAAKKKASPSE
jgi:1,4-alpha-glucan branching enzyme